MSFLKNLFGAKKLDGTALANSANKGEYAQIALLSEFQDARPVHDETRQLRWGRVLPRPYAETLELMQKQGWLKATGAAHQTTEIALPFVAQYAQRLAREKADVMPKVRAALEAKDTSQALEIRRQYEAQQPLGQADWTGPEPQMSHSALTRRILFLQHWLLDGLSAETVAWLKLYAAEQHMWGAYWQLPPAEIPSAVQAELASPHMPIAEAVYWRAYGLALYVDNQETWQRCKGGDHVRRLEITGPNDEHTCDVCRAVLGQQFLVARAPELPHRDCISTRGCRCRYEPVLEMYDDLEA
ncbi:MAG: hypothetical protein H6645_12100 [Caldilineaceae bacterium]|nr:hypothetical protein [Caldilineaceae bacterium]